MLNFQFDKSSKILYNKMTFLTKGFALLTSIILLTSCTTFTSEKKEDSLKTWIIMNQEELNITFDSTIEDYKIRKNINLNWIESSVAITKYETNIFGKLINNIKDTTECIVVELRFYKDITKKKKIMISAVDSSCMDKLKLIELDTDSTANFIFGKNNTSLY